MNGAANAIRHPASQTAAAIVAVIAWGLVSPARGQSISLEYGIDYEDQYLASCTADNDRRTCLCEMVGLEKKMTFERFAEAVQRDDGDLRHDAQWSAAVAAAADECATSATDTGAGE